MSARSMVARLALTLLRLVGVATLLAAPVPALAQSSPSAFTAATRYDLMHRVVGTIAPDPDGTGSIHFAAVRNSYDAVGNLTKVEKGELAAWQSESVAPKDWETYTTFTVFQVIDTTYDGMGRKLTEKLSHGTTAYSLAQYSYDAVGRLECTAVRMNTAAYTSLPSSACTLGTAGSYGPDRITKNVYDAAGHVLKVQKAYGITTLNGFPATLQQDYATYTYSDNGKQISVTDANGNKAAYTYDGFDRQVAWSFPSRTSAGTAAACTIGTITETSGIVSPSEARTTGDDCEKYAYDKNRNRVKLMKRDGNVIRYTYDPLNRITLKHIPGGTSADVYYAYDLRGLQSYARFASTSGSGLTNSYDGFGSLSSTSSNLDGTARTLSYRYDADGNRIRITHPDGNYFTYGYNGQDRLITIQENGSTQIASFTYDAQGRSISDTRGLVGTNIGYDDVSRINALNHDFSGASGDVTWGFSYNPSDQIVGQARDNDVYAFTSYSPVSKIYSVNGLNQYTAAESASLTYDDNGNLTSDGTTSYTYDVENRLIATSTGATLDYDPSGRLWRMSASSTTISFLYDGDALVEERDNSGALLRRYVHGNAEDDPLLWYDGSGLIDRRSLQIDHQGSITSIANADGTPRTINSYDEYGTPGSGNDGRFQYTGQAWLPAVGLYYYKARVYSPKLGRFLQVDPVGYKDQQNIYSYVGNDPANKVDPTGETTGTLFPSSDGGCGAAGDRCISSGIDSDVGRMQNAIGQADPVETKDENRGLLEGILDPLGEQRVEDYNKSHTELEKIDPYNPRLPYVATRGWVPSPAQVAALRGEVLQARRREEVIDYARRTGGSAQPGYVGSRPYANDGRDGGQVLPRAPGLSYREYDIYPRIQGINRGTERIVIGSNGSAFYTADHYLTFRQVR